MQAWSNSKMQNAPVAGGVLHSDRQASLMARWRMDEREDIGNADNVENDQYQEHGDQNTYNTRARRQLIDLGFDLFDLRVAQCRNTLPGILGIDTPVNQLLPHFATVQQRHQLVPIHGFQLLLYQLLGCHHA